MLCAANDELTLHEYIAILGGKNSDTGDACTQCGNGSVLTDGYKCELCPDETMTILVFLMGVSIFASYLIFKLRSKRKGTTDPTEPYQQPR